MGLFNKLKNILFEEEEVEIPVIEKKEKKIEQPVYKEREKEEKPTYSSSFYDDLEPVINEEKKLEERNKEVQTPIVEKEEKKEVKKEVVSEREIFKSEKTFNFPAFDEEEFEAQKPRVTNILEREKKNKRNDRNDYRNVMPKKEETQESKKFRPSPIISPVYGILDKNYTPDEITSRNDFEVRKLDVDVVRKKAFGVEKKEEVQEEIKEDSYDDILKEKLEKARTIDELLKDSSDEVITLPEEEKVESLDDIKEEEDITVPNVLEKEEPIEELNKKEAPDDDALESDLFDLIDSMYENREDGE